MKGLRSVAEAKALFPVTYSRDLHLLAGPALMKSALYAAPQARKPHVAALSDTLYQYRPANWEVATLVQGLSLDEQWDFRSHLCIVNDDALRGVVNTGTLATLMEDDVVKSSLALPRDVWLESAHDNPHPMLRVLRHALDLCDSERIIKELADVRMQLQYGFGDDCAIADEWYRKLSEPLKRRLVPHMWQSISDFAAARKAADIYCRYLWRELAPLADYLSPDAVAERTQLAEAARESMNKKHR